MSLLTAILVFAAAAWLTRAFAHPGSRLHILDHPNERSLHNRPTPRSGGVAMVLAVVIGGVVLPLLTGAGMSRELLWLGSGVMAVAGVSYLDDRRHIPVVYRLMAHVIAGGLLVAGGLVVEALQLPGISYPAPVWGAGFMTVLFVVWMINLYNFMDGMDGFAGGMALFGFGAFAAMGWMAGHAAFAAVSLVIAAAAAGFLVFNFPPARIFMGDTGSSTLGFLAAAMALWGVKADIFPFWAAILIFSPFIVDATVTLLRRLLRREKIWQAHKTHFYQRLVQAGWGHRKTVLWEYVLMVACAGSAIWAVRQTETVQWWIIGFWTVVYALLIAMVRRLGAGNLRDRKRAGSSP